MKNLWSVSVGSVMVAFSLVGCASRMGTGSERVAPQMIVGLWEGIPKVDPWSPKDTTNKTPGTHFLRINADSTYFELFPRGNNPMCDGGRWHLQDRDSLTWTSVFGGTRTEKVTVHAQQLLFYSAQGGSTVPVTAYQLADTTQASKAPFLKQLPQCVSGIRSRLATAAKSASTP